MFKKIYNQSVSNSPAKRSDPQLLGESLLGIPPPSPNTKHLKLEHPSSLG